MRKRKLNDNEFWLILVLLFMFAVMFFTWRDTQDKILANRAETLKNREQGVKNYQVLLRIEKEVRTK